MLRPAAFSAVWLIPLLVLLSTAHARAQEPVLNGSAVYQQLTRDYYLAGLWLPQPSSDPDYIYDASTSRTMQIVVIAERWSPRKWTAQWQNNIAINNDLNALTEDTRTALATFTSLLKEDLRSGDEIRIEYTPGESISEGGTQGEGTQGTGTRVLLNRETAVQTSDAGLFNLLLNTWIGKLPPSREFRQQILGMGETTLRQQHFSQLFNHPLPAERLSLFSTWQAAEKARQQAEERQRQQQLAAARALELQRQQAEQRAQEQRLREQQEQQEEAARVKQQQEEERQRQEKIQAATDEAERIVLQRDNELRNAQLYAAADQAKTLVGKTSNALGERKTAITLTREQSYYLQLLQWQLQRATAEEVVYPGWARQFSQQGLAQLDFTLQRDQQITNLRVRDSRVGTLLTQELERALKKTVATTPVPEALAGEQWPLTVYYRFTLDNQPQQEEPAPQPPSSIKAAPLNEEQQAQQMEAYQAEQREKILAAIQYPQAARILKKQGPVSAQLTITQDGALQSAEIIRPSPHRELNDALLQAIRDSAPFASFPAGVTIREQPFELTYEFRL